MLLSMVKMSFSMETWKTSQMSPLLLSPLQSVGASSPYAHLYLSTHQLLLSWHPGKEKTLLMEPKPYKHSRQKT